MAMQASSGVRSNQGIYDTFYPDYITKKEQFSKDLKNIAAFRTELEARNSSFNNRSILTLPTKEEFSQEWDTTKINYLKLQSAWEKAKLAETECKHFAKYFEPTTTISVLDEIKLQSPKFYEAIEKDLTVAKTQFQNCQQLFQDLKNCRTKMDELIPKAKAALNTFNWIKENGGSPLSKLAWVVDVKFDEKDTNLARQAYESACAGTLEDAPRTINDISTFPEQGFKEDTKKIVLTPEVQEKIEQLDTLINNSVTSAQNTEQMTEKEEEIKTSLAPAQINSEQTSKQPEEEKTTNSNKVRQRKSSSSTPNAWAPQQ